MLQSSVRLFDVRHGGFGQAPKFPHASAMDLILERYQASREKSLLTIAETTLDKMAAGGVYDQLAGGFHRYSVDERWLVPHFEKMSYDNSELLRNYLHGYQVTGKPLYREVAEGIVAWVFEVLCDRSRGGFYASQDADVSLDDDGDYFTWTLDELRAALSPDEARVMERYYDVGADGEMHHNPAKNVLWLAKTPEEISAELGMTEADVRLIVARAKGKMLEARRKRPTPMVDETIYVSWNAMMASAFLDVARVLGRDDCRAFALLTLERLVKEGWDDAAGLAHRIGGPRLPGSLDDQVFAAAALLDAYEATLDRRFFDRAQRTIELAIEKYGDVEGGGFFDRSSDAPPMGGLDIRRKPLQDSPTPGANAVAVIVLSRFYGFTGDPRYRVLAGKTLEAFAGFAPQLGLFAATYALAALLYARHTLQVVVTGAADDPAASALERAAIGVYRFGKSVLRVTPERLGDASLAPALAETISHLRPGAPVALVCVETACQQPIADPEKLSALLADLLPHLNADRIADGASSSAAT